MPEKKYIIDNNELMKEWDWNKNNEMGFNPNKVCIWSHSKVWWICNKGHGYEAQVQHRQGGSGCPYCAGKKVLVGFNDLQTTNLRLAEEWNYDKNEDLTPTMVTANSGKKVWWKCRKGHIWEARIYHRNTVSGCPICKSERNTSLPEFELLYYLRKIGLDAIHSYKKYGFELDIFIPSKQIAIEYDGYFWHKNRLKKDLEKNHLCKKQGIILYRIREGLPSTNDYSIDYIVERDNKNDLSNAIVKIVNKIANLSIDVDLERDSIFIESLREYIEKKNSISILNPELAAEWNYEKNGDLKPEFFTANSGKKVWWKCGKGHEWQAEICSRNKGRGCPFCSGRQAIKGVNDLQTINPALAKEWNYEKNIGLTPSDVLPNSEKKVWWKCSKGHEWQTMVGSRQKGNGCPFCSNKAVLKGYNDLQTINPILAKEWNYEKNEQLNLFLDKLSSGSNKKVWWKCDKGHEWQDTITHRKAGRKCPYCSNKRLLFGYNDLQTINPKLAEEWNYEKNERLTPKDVFPNSSKKVWWKCIKGHEWQATIAHRNHGTNCPECHRRVFKKQINQTN